MSHKHKWLNKIVWLNFLEKLNLTQNCLQKQHNKYSYQICLWLIVHHQHIQSIFYKGTSHWWFIGKIDNFIWKLSWYLSDLLFFFLLSDINIWYCFLLFVVTVIAVFDLFFVICCNICFFLFVVTVIAAAFHAQIFFNCSSSLWWISKWYLLFVPSLDWDSTSQMEIMKQCIPQNNLFQQMTMLQYWVY